MRTPTGNSRSTDGDKIREAMAKADFKGVTGQVKFDSDRNPSKSAVIIGIKDGRQVHKTTVNP